MIDIQRCPGAYDDEECDEVRQKRSYIGIYAFEMQMSNFDSLVRDGGLLVELHPWGDRSTYHSNQGQ